MISYFKQDGNGSENFTNGHSYMLVHIIISGAVGLHVFIMMIVYLMNRFRVGNWFKKKFDNRIKNKFEEWKTFMESN